MPHLSCFSPAFKHVPRLLPALISRSPGASRVAASQRKDQAGLHQWGKARLCQVWMGLVHHLPPQKFALGLCKSGIKASLHLVAASLSSSTVSWPSQRTMENLWMCWPCSPSFIRLVSSLRCFKLSWKLKPRERTSDMQEGYLIAATYVPLCSPHLLSFLPSSEKVQWFKKDTWLRVSFEETEKKKKCGVEHVLFCFAEMEIKVCPKSFHTWSWELLEDFSAGIQRPDLWQPGFRWNILFYLIAKVKD